MEPFLGQIMAVGFNFAPRGWALCNGQLLSIAQNTALFSLLGTTYGGDGRTTFALPDLRGRVPIHQGRGPGLSDYSLGEEGGVENVTLNATEIPAHGHTASVRVPYTNEDGDESSPSATNMLARGIVTQGRDTLADANIYKKDARYDGDKTLPVTVANSGGNQSHTNRQPYLSVNYIIALSGLFPSRS